MRAKEKIIYNDKRRRESTHCSTKQNGNDDLTQSGVGL
jgi:hypothetical protein